MEYALRYKEIRAIKIKAQRTYKILTRAISLFMERDSDIIQFHKRAGLLALKEKRTAVKNYVEGKQLGATELWHLEQMRILKTEAPYE